MEGLMAFVISSTVNMFPVCVFRGLLREAHGFAVTLMALNIRSSVKLAYLYKVCATVILVF